MTAKEKQLIRIHNDKFICRGLAKSHVNARTGHTVRRTRKSRKRTIEEPLHVQIQRAAK